MSDLAGFLAARLDEDEVIAQGAARTDDGLGGNWVPAAIAGKWLSADARVDDHVAAHDPARVLREVKAKRAITGEQTSDHAPVESIYGTTCRTCVAWEDAPLAEGGETEFGIAIPVPWPCRVARSAAAAYSDHPDYDPSWSVS